MPGWSSPSTAIVNDINDVSSVNLRSCPSVTGGVVGEMFASQQVLAVGMVSDGSWIQVEYPDSSSGTAWIYGKLVLLIGGPPPVVMELPTPTPLLPAISPQACTPIDIVLPQSFGILKK